MYIFDSLKGSSFLLSNIFVMKSSKIFDQFNTILLLLKNLRNV